MTKLKSNLVFSDGTTQTTATAVATPTTLGTVKGLTGDYAAAEQFFAFGKAPISITVTNPSGTTLVLTLNNGDTWSSIYSGGSGFVAADEFIVGRVVSVTDNYYPASATYNWVTGGVVSSFTSNTLTLSSYTSTAGGTMQNQYIYVVFPSVTTGGYGNTLLGNKAGLGLGTFSEDTADNIAIGNNAMSQNTANGNNDTINNIAIGTKSGNDFEGFNNIFIGNLAGNDITQTGAKRTFSGNIFIGHRTGTNVMNNLSGCTIIGYNMTGTAVGGNDAVVLGQGDNMGVVVKNNYAVNFPNQGYIHYRVGTNYSYNNSAQNVTVIFNTYVDSIGNIPYSTSTGKISVNTSGLYEVSCGLEATTNVEQLWGVVNSVRTQTFAHGTGTNLAGSAIFKLSSTDTFGIAGAFGGGATTINAQSLQTYLKIRYLG